MHWKLNHRVVALLGSLFLLLSGSCTVHQEIPRSPYLDAATEVGTWLTAQANAQGYIPDEAFADSSYSASLGSGAGGRALFFLELFNATSDSSYLTSAQSEADAALDLTLAAAARGDARAGLYNGVAGSAFVLAEMHRITGVERYRNALPTLIPLLKEVARGEPVNDVLVGAAGVGLVLLHLAEDGENGSLLADASALGDTLLRRGVRAAHGTYWMRAQDMDFNLPNFSHGAAGIGYYLARLYEATRQPRYLAGAEDAAQYLMAIAEQEGGLFLVPYGVPNEGFATPYDIGWAHGPPGTARLFYLLWKITGKKLYSDVVERNVQSLSASGIPGTTRDSLRWRGPFRIDQRFGTSGAATFLLKLHRASRNAAYLSLGRTLIDDLLDKSHTSLEGRYWALPRYGFQGQPDEDASYTGYFYGAAGLGLALLEMHYAEVDQAPRIVFPDSPFRAPS